MESRFFGRNPFVIDELYVFGFLNEDFHRAFGCTLRERPKLITADHHIGCASDRDSRADGPVPVKDTRRGAEARKRVAFDQDARAVVRGVFRRITHLGFFAGNSRYRRSADDNVGVVVVGENAVAHGKVANGRSFLEIPFGSGENSRLEAIAERAAFDRAIGGFQVEALCPKDLELAVADDGFLPHRRHVDEPVDAVNHGLAAEVHTHAHADALGHDITIQSNYERSVGVGRGRCDDSIHAHFFVLPVPELHSVARAVIVFFCLHEQGPLVSLLDNACVIRQDINAVVVDFGKIAVI